MFVECVRPAILFALHYLQLYLTLLNLLVYLLFQLLAFFHVGAVNRIDARHLVNCFREATRRRRVLKIPAALIGQFHSRASIGIAIGAGYRDLVLATANRWRDARIVKRLIIQCNGRYFQLTATDAHFAIRICRWTQVRVLFDLLLWIEQIVKAGAATWSLTCPALIRTDCVQIKCICQVKLLQLLQLTGLGFIILQSWTQVLNI